MKGISKKITAVILSAVMLVTGLFFAPAKSEAATGYDVILQNGGDATAGQEITYDYTIKKTGTTDNAVVVYSQTGVNIAIYKADQCIDSWYVSAYSSDWEYSEGCYVYGFTMPYSSTGDYQIRLNFDSNVGYGIAIIQDKNIPVISNKSITITKGFKKKLSVKDAGGTVKWSSSKKSVATVDSKGKVTAKKKGTATISAKTKDGSVLKCKVTVKDNIYTASKPVVSQVPYGQSILSVYRMSYDKKGNLILKCRIINNKGYNAYKIKNASVQVKAPNGKIMGTASLKSKSISISTGSYKDITMSIKKSKLKIKKADLRNSSIGNIKGTVIYKMF